MNPVSYCSGVGRMDSTPYASAFMNQPKHQDSFATTRNVCGTAEGVESLPENQQRPAVQGQEADPIYTGRADVPCLGSVINGMGSWGSTATAHWAACSPNKSARGPAWEVFVIIMQHCQGHLSGVQKDKSPIRNWLLCAVFLAWANYRAHAPICFLTETKQSQRISHWWSLYMNNLLPTCEGRMGRKAFCRSNLLFICSSHELLLCLVKEWLIHRSSKQGSRLQKIVISDTSIFASSQGPCPHNCSAMCYMASQ